MTTSDANDWGNFHDRPLYKLLVKGLPEYCKTYSDGRTRLKMTQIARAIDMKKQGIYKRFEPGAENTISTNMARKFIDLSESQFKSTAAPEGFKPLTLLDFEPFLT